MALPRDVQYLLSKLYKDRKIKTYRKHGRLKLGALYLFAYPSPKYKKTLPYYDQLPLVILLKSGGGYIEGINVHYLPWTYRIQFVRQVIKRLSYKNRITYIDLKKAWDKAKIPQVFAKFAYRKYIITLIRSKLKMFDHTNWEEVTKDVLPKFRKEQDEYIYREINRFVVEQRKKVKG